MSNSMSLTSWKCDGSVTLLLKSILAWKGRDSEGTVCSESILAGSSLLSVFSSRKWKVNDGGSLWHKQETCDRTFWTPPQNKLPVLITHGSSSLRGFKSDRDGCRTSTFSQNERSHGSITASGLFQTAGEEFNSRIWCWFQNEGGNISPQVMLIICQPHRNQHPCSQLQETLVELLSNKIKPEARKQKMEFKTLNLI